MNSEIVIGILCIDISKKLYEEYADKVTAYIDEKYVIFFKEIPSVSVIPILIGKEHGYYADIMKKINGVVFPGGALYLDSACIQEPWQTNTYVEATEEIYRIACEMNNGGVYFPILAICLGYDLMLYHCANKQDPRVKCTPLRRPMELEFKIGYRESRMFKDAPIGDESKPCVVHNHMFCVPEETLSKFGIADQWTVTATNKDDEGQEFISALEHKAFPFYGVQFHPEKEHENACKNFREYFANFFVSECQKNSNGFLDVEDHKAHIFPINSFSQKNGCYLFHKNCL